MQASCFERLSFDPFPLFQDGFVTSEVDVRRRDVVQALMISLVVVVIDEQFTFAINPDDEETNRGIGPNTPVNKGKRRKLDTYIEYYYQMYQANFSTKERSF